MNQDFTLFEQRLIEAGYDSEVIEQILEVAQNSIYPKKYGLVWEEKKEKIKEDLKLKIPYLEELNEREIKLSDANSPQHLLIEGDNYEALKLLQTTHKGKINVVYIDPPYNTGKEFIYNDNLVDREDGYRHSKWLSFMSKRLTLAKELMSEDGVIFISIGDDEFAQLKLLCDEIFGEDNFITMFIWEKTQHFGRQKKNAYSNGDYILCYSKSLFFIDKKKKSKKELLVEYQKDIFEDAPLYNKSNKEHVLLFKKGTVKFNIPDGIYKNSKDKKYILQSEVKVINSFNANDLIIKFKSRWQQSTVEEHINKNGTFIVKTENFAIRAIYGDRDSSNESPKQLLFTNNTNDCATLSRFGIKVGTNEEGSSLLGDILPNSKFDYPKPTSLIHYLISIVFNEKKSSYNDSLVILDFFAGSGTTGHAVLELNQKDGGNRQFILCTNNENNICEEVTYERLKRVMNGYTTPKGKEVEGLPANLKYLKVGMLEKETYTDEDLSRLYMPHVLPLLQLKHNAFTLVSETKHGWIFEGEGFRFGLADSLATKRDFDALKTHLETYEGEKVLYLFSTDTKAYPKYKQLASLDEIIRPIPREMLELLKGE